MPITITIKGLNEVVKKFESMPREFISEMDKAVKRSAYLVEGESKKVTPVLTGRLRASISSVFSTLQAIVSPHTDYAIYVHQGTYAGHIPEPRGEGQKGMQARPFMLWGAEKAVDAIKKEFGEAIKVLINK